MRLSRCFLRILYRFLAIGELFEIKRNYFAKSVDSASPKIVLYMRSKDSKWRMP